jgi:chemotaxis protein methyltransferase CheR
MMKDREQFQLSDAEFRIFSGLLRSRCGLHFDETTRFLVEKRLSRRIAEAEYGSVAAYLYALRNGLTAEEELSTVIDLLTTNETYFLRERSQLNALVGEVVPELLSQSKRGGRPVSIWSAGCSSGEEPFSIVILALEAGLASGRDFRVYASDISRTALAKARRGVYREASFRETEERLRSTYFSQKDGLARISDEVKREVDFIRLNLLDRSKLALLGPMDVILCRNVMIYFDADAKKQVVATFHDKLHPGGHLFLGHAESLINVSSGFDLRHLQRDLVYRRPIPGEEREDPWRRLTTAGVDERESDRCAR